MTEIEHVTPRRRLPVATGILVLIALAILISLGTWQVERLHWKEGLLADIAARQAASPVPLADIEAIAAAGGDIEYRKVTATGRYINNKERHFFATWRGQTGYYIYTPLELADGRALFVNRGFVPFDNKEPEMRMQGQLTDQQTVTGLARSKLTGKPSWVVPDNDVAKNIFYWKDLDVMASSVGLEKARVIPFFVDADSTPNPAGLPIGGVTQVDLPNDHLQYAFTWYGLAAVLVVVVVISWFRKGTKAAPQ
ncbi:surfeit locus 1 family protein [Rhizobium leguminosarum]|uniref:SURF1-like protein n=1 Tax=Rhizobium leguminosarum TaxID=384 RepID=A0AAE2MGA4_RHILE|nr:MULTISPECIES: SURF1 family protein [Rhizobium]MBB4288751.1 surfeit locus 1 family protein [Rhizobium leguminosarum]MBB4295156.1 surfeit locus 1 family protein [Rhizobium leguminosarum]MBB4306549.1 surfeit locus 1 family protein [Rhizobium leguminosarum]MBB4417869.1 surfeit locus 1 family protein [Rhizobium leguminosarum]MBB4432715.1 surfeit locus 1 family protein [Rhizobium esperanzae]